MINFMNKAVIIFLEVFIMYLMESISFLSTIFISCALISITLYSIYVGFGPKSKNLRDPFEEHED